MQMDIFRSGRISIGTWKVSTTNTAAFNFNLRGNVLQCFFPYFERSHFYLSSFRNEFHCIVKNIVGDTFLTIHH